MSQTESQSSPQGGSAHRGTRIEFTCDKCRTTYTIPEERVIGRVLKIRCSRCRHVVEVFGPPAVNPPAPLESALQVEQATPAGAIVKASPPQAQKLGLGQRLSGLVLKPQLTQGQRLPHSFVGSAAEESSWFAIVEGRALGPIEREELIIMAKRGTVHARSYVWRPGMAGWQRVETGPALAFLRDEVRSRLQTRTKPRQLTGMESGIFVVSGLFDSAALDGGLQGAPALPEPQARSADAEVSPFDTVESAANAKLDPDAWYVVNDDEQQELWTRDYGPEVRGTTALGTGRYLLRRRRRSYLLAAVVAGAAAMLCAGVLFLAWLTRDGNPLADRVVAPAVEMGHRVYKPSREIIDKIRTLLDPRRAQGVRWPEVGLRRSTDQAVTPVSGRDSSAETQVPPAELGTATMVAAPQLPSSLDLTARDVVRVVENRRPQLEACYDAALKRASSLSGALDVSIIVGVDGRVRRVAVHGGDDTAGLARCLRQRMRRWAFPRPSHELEVVLPLRLRRAH